MQIGITQESVFHLKTEYFISRRAASSERKQHANTIVRQSETRRHGIRKHGNTHRSQTLHKRKIVSKLIKNDEIGERVPRLSFKKSKTKARTFPN